MIHDFLYYIHSLQMWPLAAGWRSLIYNKGGDRRLWQCRLRELWCICSAAERKDCVNRPH